MAQDPTHYTVAKLSEALHVDAHAVLSWIKSGELEAFDVRRPGSKRASWRISSEAFECFKQKRSNARPGRDDKPTRRRRSRAAAATAAIPTYF